MIVYAICNHKGGVAKSTTSINIAAGLTRKGFRVLVIDLDDQANATDLVLNEEEYDPDKTIYQVLEGKTGIADCIVHTKLGFDLIPSDLDLDEIDRKNDQIGLLDSKVRKLKDDYDFLIIDNKPSRGSLVKNALYATRNNGLVIIPAKMGRASFKGVYNIKLTIDDINEMYDQEINFKILGAMKNRNKRECEEYQQLIASYPGKAFNTYIRYQASPVKKYEDNRQAVIDDPKAGVAEDYRRLVEEMTGGRNNGSC